MSGRTAVEESAAAPGDGGQRILTPTSGRMVRRLLFWVGALVFIFVVGFVTLLIAGSGAGGEPLSPTNPAPGGTMAVAQVLEQQGVKVTSTTNLDDTTRAVGSGDSTTLVLYDGNGYLTRDQLIEVTSKASRVVLIDPDFSQLRAVAPEVVLAGYAPADATKADCEVSAVQKAGTVSGGGSAFRLAADGTPADECLETDAGAYQLIVLDEGATIVLGATGALTNELVANDGNAAFALNLLGASDSLVWYLPGLDDLAANQPDSADLSPSWVIPVLLLLGVVFVVAAIWRGRRFGPLVIENLPVTVRASETMQGRARLYEKSSSRLRALDALRVGSVQRLAVSCGLPRTATLDDVIVSCAAITGGSVTEIRRLLVDVDPATDHDLMRLSDALLTLEHDVARAVRP